MTSDSSPDAIQAVAREQGAKRRDGLLNGWFARGGWKTVDPIYIWSAAAGLFVALVLIAFAVLMDAGRLQ